VERAASRWIVSSDADEHVERIGYYVGLGFGIWCSTRRADQAAF